MTWLISLLAPRIGLGFARAIVWVGLPLLIIGLVWWRVDAWGDRRFNQGVEAHRAEVRAATEELKASAERSATRADDAAALRVEDHLQQTAEERERLDEAAQNGSSPIDVLFGS